MPLPYICILMLLACSCCKLIVVKKCIFLKHQIACCTATATEMLLPYPASLHVSSLQCPEQAISETTIKPSPALGIAIVSKQAYNCFKSCIAAECSGSSTVISMVGMHVGASCKKSNNKPPTLSALPLCINITCQQGEVLKCSHDVAMQSKRA